VETRIAPAWTPYCGPAPDPATWLGRWTFDPLLISVLLALLALSTLRPRQGRRACAIVAVAVAALAFVSPLCALSSALFSARTVHHLLLVAVVAPLAATALPRPAGRPRALAAALVQAAVFWGWHAPAAYGWALASDVAYWLMQATLLGAAIWFWAVVRSVDPLRAVAALLTAMVLMGLLGAILTLAPTPLYAPHLISADVWGLGALKDQQLAGLIMWAPAAGLYLAVALWRLSRQISPARRTAAA
jgi:putative membrane protein